MEDIYKATIEGLKKKPLKWRFILGEKSYSADDLIQRMEKDKEFRDFVLKEIVKTATELMSK